MQNNTKTVNIVASFHDKIEEDDLGITLFTGQDHLTDLVIEELSVEESDEYEEIPTDIKSYFPEIIHTEQASKKGQACVAKVLHAKKAKGIPINDQAIAIALSECGMPKKKKTKTSSPIFEDGKYPFSILAHWKGKDLIYEFQVQMTDKIKAISLKSSGTIDVGYNIETCIAAKSITCKCLGNVGNDSGISRLFSQFSEPKERTNEWFNFEGVTKDTKEVFLPLIKGSLEIKNTQNSTELYFDSKEMNGRWLFRSLPNIFDNGFIKGDQMYMLWKPDTKETQMTDKLENIKLMNPKDIPGDIKKIKSSLSTKITQLAGSNEFDVVVAAEGTWIDRFGQKFTYTKDFIHTLFNSMNSQLLKGVEHIGVDKEHSQIDNGKMTSLQLVDEPVTYIRGRGFFNGEIGDANGASIDAELDAVFVPTFKSWFPLRGVTKRVSLVASPACKLCHFLPK